MDAVVVLGVSLPEESVADEVLGDASIVHQSGLRERCNVDVISRKLLSDYCSSSSQSVRRFGSVEHGMDVPYGNR